MGDLIILTVKYYLLRQLWIKFSIGSKKQLLWTVFHMSSINHYVSLQSMNATSLVPTGSSVSVWWLSTQRGERPVKRRSAGNKESGETASFPLSLGSYFWGLSSGSFKWGLVTAGTSWTKLLLPAPLLCCSHSPLIGFDCICLNPQWKKEKGGWRGCSETEVCQFVQTRWHFRKKKRGGDGGGYHSPGLLNKGWGYDAWWVTEQASSVGDWNKPILVSACTCTITSGGPSSFPLSAGAPTHCVRWCMDTHIGM